MHELLNGFPRQIVSIPASSGKNLIFLTDFICLPPLIVIFSCLPFFTERHHAGDIYVLARKAGQGVDPAGHAAGAAGGVQGVTVGVSDAAHQPARAAQLGQPGHPGAAQRGRRAARE